MAIIAAGLSLTAQLTFWYFLLIFGLLTLLSALMVFLRFLISESLLNWILTGNFEKLNQNWNSKNPFSNLKFEFWNSPIFLSLTIAIVCGIIGYVVFLMLNFIKNSFVVQLRKNNIIWLKLKNFGKIILFLYGIGLFFAFMIILVSGLMVLLEFWIKQTNHNENQEYWNLNNFELSKKYFLEKIDFNNLKEDLKNIKYIKIESDEFQNLIKKVGGENSSLGQNLILWIQKYNHLFFEDNNALVNNQEELNKIINLFDRNINFQKIYIDKSLVQNDKQLLSLLSFWKNELKNLEIDLDNLLKSSKALNIDIKNDLDNLIGMNNLKTTYLNLILEKFNLAFFDNNSSSTNIFTYKGNVWFNDLYYQSLSGELGLIEGNNLTTLLYRLALNKKDVNFIPGWGISGVLKNGLPPKSIMIPFVNITGYGLENVRLLVFGGGSIAIITFGVFSFVLTLMKRAIFIVTWPLKNIYSLVVAAYDDGELFLDEFRELIIKFFEILVIILFWIIFEKIILRMYDSFVQSEVFKKITFNEEWLQFFIKLLFLITSLISTFFLCITYTKKIAQTSSPLEEASQIAHRQKQQIQNSNRSRIQRSQIAKQKMNSRLEKSKNFFSRERQPVSAEMRKNNIFKGSKIKFSSPAAQATKKVINLFKKAK